MPLSSSHHPANPEVMGPEFGQQPRYLPMQEAWHLSPAVTPVADSRTILFVETDEDLRVVMQVFLEAVGYAVLACADAESASVIFRSGVAVNMLLTETELPGRSGFELARELTALRPSLPVLIVSGCPVSTMMKGEMQAGNWRFHGKPCSFGILTATIQALLGSSEKLAA